MKTKWFRVCRSGKTIDGREITPAQIDQMAATYDPAVYGARVFIEHLRAIIPDGPLAALGDVVAVKAESDPDGARVLLAQIDATSQLVKLAETRQKVFWSAEIAPNMAGTGKAYLAGLAVTDSPASLGTEMLRFSIGNDKLPAATRDNLYGEPVEAGPLTAEVAPATDAGQGLIDRVRTLLTGHDKRTEGRLAAAEGALLELAGAIRGLHTQLTGSSGSAASPPMQPPATAAGPPPAAAPAAPPAQAADPIAALTAEVKGLREALSRTAATPPRPAAAGLAATADTHTDC